MCVIPSKQLKESLAQIERRVALQEANRIAAREQLLKIALVLSKSPNLKSHHR